MIQWDWSMLVGTFTLVFSSWLAVRYFLINEQIYLQRPKHNWKSIKLLNRACFCSHCEILLSSTGKFCDNCGICSHPNCIPKTESNVKLRCKDKYNKDSKPSGEQKHHWVRGNHPPNRICVHCKEEMDEDHGPGLAGWSCCWCSRSVHSQCFGLLKDKDTEQCDFGEFQSMIIPPSCITAVRRRGTSKLMLKTIKPPPKTPNWRPVIIVANMKSGSSLAEDILSHFRGILNPLQVIELTRRGPEMVVKWLERLKPFQCRILIAGGDGTVGWIMNTIFERKVRPLPEIAILPLGTGNDLSRVLNWGSETDTFSHEMAVDMLRDVVQADEIKLDRWMLEMWGAFTRIPLPQKHRHKVFLYNYFSIGVDAQVTLNFHKARDSAFYLLSSRLLNKLLYLCFGTHQVLQPDCVGLDKSLELYLDGEKVDLPDLQSVVCLNIDSWGAGVQLGELSRTGGEGDSVLTSPSDGYLDVYGIVSSFHIAQLQVGLSKPIRLGRAQTVKIKLHNTAPVQADGEPWQQVPCEMTVHRVEQANVLMRKQ